MTTGKTIALAIRTFVGKVMSLLFNTLSRFVIAFLPRSKSLLVSSEKEIAEGNISVRDRETDQTAVYSLEDFAAKLNQEIKERK